MNAFAHTTIGRMFEPFLAQLPAEVSQKIIDFQADEALQARIEYLATQANEDELTTEETAEYESYIAAGDLVATIQAIARRRLRAAAD